jgi:hypothetical protein
MDFLVLSPPVSTPAEPPSGAFMLAAGLAGHGYETGLLDLSLELYHKALRDPSIPGPSTLRSLKYLLTASEGYDPQRHRSETGVLHKKLTGFSTRFPGWRLTLMDIDFPGGVHDPVAIAALFERGASPFTDLWQEVLSPVLSRLKPGKVLVSLAYLSQLPGAIDLVRFLKSRGVHAVVGGSLPTSLKSTGLGIEALSRVFPSIVTGDGMSLISSYKTERMLGRLAWPMMVSPKPYLSARPVVPLALSTGCHWSRCLYCPDRTVDFNQVPEKALEQFLTGMPRAVSSNRPLFHLLDSSVPPRQLKRFLDLAQNRDIEFYGFFRPTNELLRENLLDRAAANGLTMVQLGVDSGSDRVLERFDKGIASKEAEAVLRQAAELGIRTYLYLLFGLPKETHAERMSTLEFVLRNSDKVDFLNLSMFNLPRFCELNERADEFDIEPEDFPADGSIRLYWRFTCSGSSPREEARRFIKETFNRHPRIREAILRTPRWLRAAHLALMQKTTAARGDPHLSQDALSRSAHQM